MVLQIYVTLVVKAEEGLSQGKRKVGSEVGVTEQDLPSVHCSMCCCHEQFLWTVKASPVSTLEGAFRKSPVPSPCRALRLSPEHPCWSGLCSPPYFFKFWDLCSFLKMPIYHFLDLIFSIIFIFPLCFFLLLLLNTHRRTHTHIHIHTSFEHVKCARHWARFGKFCG